ncbi:MAG: hypothetical protein R3F48_03620 [Candidatus Zixiibacteriota bacterium]
MPDDVILGNHKLLNFESAAVLNSRQSAYPVGSDAWVRQTLRAVEYIAGRGWTVVTSVGMNTWELVLACAAKIGMPVIVIAAIGETSIEDLIAQYGLSPDNLCLTTPHGRVSDKERRLTGRDTAVCRRADWLIPVAVRPDGNLERLLDSAGGRVFNRYRIPYKKPKRKRPVYSGKSFSDELSDDHWLIHFTRSCRGPWPGETCLDYYRAVLHSNCDYCHCAREGLQKIIREGIIRGSTRNIRSGHRVVAFTLYNSEAARNLFRYRSRLANPYFEPYGIAVAKSWADRIGLYPVVYGDDEIYNGMAEAMRPYFQAEGEDGRWIGEREWRIVGDVALQQLNPDYTRIVVASPGEKALFDEGSAYPVSTVFG